MVNVVVVFEQAGVWLRHESKADTGTLQLQLSRLDSAPMLQTSPYSLTHTHSNCRGVVVQALIAILRDADLPRRHASPKLVAGLCGASKQYKATANRALHAQSCGVVLIKVGKQHHTGAVGDVAGTGVAEFKHIHVGRHLGWKVALAQGLKEAAQSSLGLAVMC